MTTRAEQIWKTFCDELRYDKGIKDTEDVRQALATALREVINLSNEWIEIGGDSWDARNVVHVSDMMEIADELDELK